MKTIKHIRIINEHKKKYPEFGKKINNKIVSRQTNTISDNKNIKKQKILHNILKKS